MAWIQIFLQFIADMAWPVVALIVLLAFRKEIGSLLLRLRKLIYKGAVLDFADITDITMKEDAIQTKDKQDSIEMKDVLGVTEQDCTYDKYLTLLQFFTLMLGAVVLLPTRLRWRYQFAQDLLKGSITKIEKERPNSRWFKPMRAIEKHIEAAADKYGADE